jgi:hypothetical protein
LGQVGWKMAMGKKREWMREGLGRYLHEGWDQKLMENHRSRVTTKWRNQGGMKIQRGLGGEHHLVQVHGLSFRGSVEGASQES